MKDNINISDLRDMYVEKNMSSKQIAEKLGVTPSAVYAACYKHGIKKTNRGKATRKSEASAKFSRKLVYENYITRNLTVNETAKKLGTTPATVCQLLKEYNIVKPAGAYSKGGCPDKETLEKELADCNYSVQLLASMHGVSRMTIYNWLKQQGVDSKRQKQNDENALSKLAEEDGKTLNEIADALGCTQSIAKRNLEQAGYELYVSDKR